MELRPGYQRTEVGDIPLEWKVKRADDLCMKIQDGTHFSPSSDGQDYPYVTSRNIGKGVLDISDAGMVSASDHRRIYRRCDVRTGDLLLTKDGANTGNAALNTLPDEFSLLSSVAFLRFDPGEHCAGYFLQYLLSGAGQSRIKQLVSGNAITRLTLAKIKGLRLPVPPLPEQRAISTALGDIDTQVAALDRLIAKKRDVKQGAMQELLTGRRRLLPGFSGEWPRHPLKTIASMHGRIGWQGLTQAEFTMKADDPYLITGMNFRDGAIAWEEVYHIPEARYQEALPIQLRPGDVLVTKDGTIGKLLYVDHIPYPGKASLNSHLLVFRPVNGAFLPKFLYYQLASKRFQDHIDLEKSGTTFFGITQEAVGNYLAHLPSLAEQQAIAAVLSDIDAEIAALEAQRDKTNALKQGMMQELLTGRTRLL
ncbi:MAG: restriction endonuclease subunit S [Anaerolineales bacterium]|nr:restriction endonuclease subunit S [Anaerolineales bacterium]